MTVHQINGYSMSLPGGGTLLVCTWGNCHKTALCGDTSGMSIWGMERYRLCKRRGCHLKAQVHTFYAVQVSALVGNRQTWPEEVPA